MVRPSCCRVASPIPYDICTIIFNGAAYLTNIVIFGCWSDVTWHCVSSTTLIISQQHYLCWYYSLRTPAMVFPCILLVHLACRLYIALCCCGFICSSELGIILPCVPRKHKTHCLRETSLCFHRPPVDSYSTRSARPVGSVIICWHFGLQLITLMLTEA
jgi:hypothetical protein